LIMRQLYTAVSKNRGSTAVENRRGLIPDDGVNLN
jgi:hypothetical protein